MFLDVNISRNMGKESILQNPYDSYCIVPSFFPVPYGDICLQGKRFALPFEVLLLELVLSSEAHPGRK